MDQRPQFTNADYTVIWLCALVKSELTAARKMLDREHKDPANLNKADGNAYFFGDIAGHNVVIACMPPGQPGNLSAQKLVQPLKQSFPNMDIHLFVGIGGGIPRNPPSKDPNADIHLGDIVVGWAEQTGVPAVVHYEYGRYHKEGKVELFGTLDKPDRRLLSALGSIMSDHEMKDTKYHHHLRKLDKLEQFRYPGLDKDILFDQNHDHVDVGQDQPCCFLCDRTLCVDRPRREVTVPQFHQGTILTGNMVMHSARRRDELSKLYYDAICIEMEAAGVVDDTHCLVIRGISDYADSHKHWTWQCYAAATAAAFARELLHKIRPVVVGTGNSGENGFGTSQAMLKFDQVAFTRIMNQGEKHSHNSPEGLSAALGCFSQADAMLRQSGNDDSSLQLQVYFRLTTVECDLSHNRHWSIEERIEHIRRAEENGSMAWRAALNSQKAIYQAQVRLELSFLKGRKAELEEQRGEASAWEIRRVKADALREMKDAMQELGDLDRDKYAEYLKRTSKWETRLLSELCCSDGDDC